LATPIKNIKERLAALEAQRAREALEADAAMASGTRGIVSQRLAAFGKQRPAQQQQHPPIDRDLEMARAMQAQFDAELANAARVENVANTTPVLDTSGDAALAEKLAREWGTFGH